MENFILLTEKRRAAITNIVWIRVEVQDVIQYTSKTLKK